MNRIVASMHKKIGAFSLAEAMIVMLIITMVALISAPVITKKRRLMNANLTHGKWACKYNSSGELVQAVTTPDGDFKEWNPVEGANCVFPKLPKNVKFLYVEVFGAGGGGSRGSAEPWVDYTLNLKSGETVKVPGDYSFSFRPNFDIINPKFATSGAYYVDNYNYFHLTQDFLKETQGFCLLEKNTFPKFVRASDDTDDVWGSSLKTETVAECNTYKLSNVEEDNSCIHTGENIDKSSLNNCWYYKAVINGYKVKVANETTCSLVQGEIDGYGRPSAPEWLKPDGSSCNCPAGVTTSCVIPAEYKVYDNKEEAEKYSVDKTSEVLYAREYDVIGIVSSYPVEKEFCTVYEDATTIGDYEQTILKQPPHYYITRDVIDGLCTEYEKSLFKLKPTCKWYGDKLTITTKNYTCPDVCDISTLETKEGYGRGVNGVVSLEVGQQINYKETTGKRNFDNRPDDKSFYLEGQSSYEGKLVTSKDGNDYEIYIDDPLEGKETLLTIKGPSAGYLGSEDYLADINTGYESNSLKCEPPSRSCYFNEDCHKYMDFSFPYSQATYQNIEPIYAKRGSDSVLTVKSDKIKSFESGSTSYFGQNDFGLNIIDQRFQHYIGCYGENGSVNASIIMAVPNGGYKFHVGKGGKGAQGDGNEQSGQNNITVDDAKDGEASYFGPIIASGGKAAVNSCSSKNGPIENRPDSVNTYDSSSGLGGAYGEVTYKNPPGRKYERTKEDDKEPEGRWNVENGGDGTGGMIVVSW